MKLGSSMRTTSTIVPGYSRKCRPFHRRAQMVGAGMERGTMQDRASWLAGGERGLLNGVDAQPPQQGVLFVSRSKSLFGGNAGIHHDQTRPLGRR